MKTLPVDKLEVGMIIADDVKNAQNMLLAPSGLEITAKHLITFKTWGINKVKIESDGEDGDIGISPEKLIELDTKIEHVFRFNKNSDINDKIKTVAKSYMLNNLEAE